MLSFRRAEELENRARRTRSGIGAVMLSFRRAEEVENEARRTRSSIGAPILSFRRAEELENDATRTRSGIGAPKLSFRGPGNLENEATGQNSDQPEGLFPHVPTQRRDPPSARIHAALPSVKPAIGQGKNGTKNA